MPPVHKTTTQKVGSARVLTSLEHIEIMEERDRRKKEAKKKEQRQEERLRKKALIEERKKTAQKRTSEKKKGTRMCIEYISTSYSLNCYIGPCSSNQPETAETNL